MAKIAEYAVVTAKDTAALQKKVNQRIREGWQPHGSLLNVDGRFVQALVLDQQSLERLRKSSEDGTAT